MQDAKPGNRTIEYLIIINNVVGLKLLLIKFKLIRFGHLNDDLSNHLFWSSINLLL